MGAFADLLGTVKSTFKIGKANLDASGLTAARTHTLPNKSGTLATTADVGGIVSTTTLTVGYGKRYAEATITDASISAGSKVAVDWAPNIVDSDENGPEMDASLGFIAIAASGSALVRVFSDFPFGGVIKVQYQVS